MPDDSVQVVRPEDILKETGLSQAGIRIGTWTQRAGMRLALGVGIVAALIITFILVNWCRMSPTPPTITGSTPVADAENMIKNYRALSDQATQTAIQMFENMIMKSLLPVFTGILGYIFATRNAASN